MIQALPGTRLPSRIIALDSIGSHVVCSCEDGSFWVLDPETDIDILLPPGQSFLGATHMARVTSDGRLEIIRRLLGAKIVATFPPGTVINLRGSDTIH